MKLGENSRRLGLGIALFATVIASVWANRQESDSIQLIEAVSASADQAARPKVNNESVPSHALELDKLERAELDVEEIESDLFDAQSWYVPPPPPPPMPIKVAQPVIPPAPVAPPLPFVYMGTMEDNGRVTIYLAKGDRPYSVSVGDTIDGAYHVDGIENGQIVFTYLPMSFRQTLKTGS